MRVRVRLANPSSNPNPNPNPNPDSNGNVGALLDAAPRLVQSLETLRTSVENTMSQS